MAPKARHSQLAPFPTIVAMGRKNPKAKKEKKAKKKANKEKKAKTDKKAKKEKKATTESNDGNEGGDQPNPGSGGRKLDQLAAVDIINHRCVTAAASSSLLRRRCLGGLLASRGWG
jgi:hypothetical protein